MSFYTLWLIALVLSMDSFAVSIAFCFGFFQALMPAIGYVLGSQFNKLIQYWDHWIAFVLLSLIGMNMIREGFRD